MKNGMELVKKNNFNELIDNVYQTHCLLQLNTQKAVNRIWRTASAKLQWIDFNDFIFSFAKEIQIRQSLPAELQKFLPIPIRGSLTPKLQMTENQENTIHGSVTRESVGKENVGGVMMETKKKSTAEDFSVVQQKRLCKFQTEADRILPQVVAVLPWDESCGKFD
jgi:hypothetical protein